VLALDLLGIFLAHRVLFRFDMTLIGAPTIGVIARDAEGF
jgi:hypothetical protein